MGWLLLSLGFWCTQRSVCALQVSILQSCVSSGSSVVGLMVMSSKKVYAIPKSAAPRAPGPVAVHYWPILPYRTCSKSSVSVSAGSLGPGAPKGLFEPFEHLWREWGLILYTDCLLLPSCWGFSDLGRGVSPHEVTGVSPHEITMWLHSNWSEVTGQSLRQSLSKPEIPPNSLIIILTWSFFLPWGFPFASWMWTL